MATPSTTVTLNTINSITHPKVAQKIADNITGKIPLLYFLNRIGHKEHENGGTEYRIPVFKELTSGQWYIGTTALTSPDTDHVTTAIYQRKQLTIPITLTGTKLLQNSGGGEEAVINYIAAQLEMAEESMKAALAGSANGIFSSNGESDTGCTGLQNIITDSTTTGTVGGLSRATYSSKRHGLCKTDSDKGNPEIGNPYQARRVA